MSSEPNPPRILLLSQGRLESVAPGGARSRLESAFAREMVDRHERHNQINAWKNDENPGACPFSRGALWGGGGARQPLPPPRFLSVVPGFQPGEFFYTMRISMVSALLRMDGKDGRERRILHKTDFREEGICCDPATRRMVMAVGVDDGSSHLVLCDHEATIRKELTGGDSIDANPSISRQKPSKILYQSSGIARSQHGGVWAVGPASIQTLDLDTLEHGVVVESSGHDHLLPVQTGDGSIWFIRRPWNSRHAASPWRTLLDLVLIPWKLAKAVFGFLDAFTAMFGKDRLRRAGAGDPQAGADEMRALFLGRPIEAKRTAGRDGTVKPPADWLLVKRSVDGSEEIVARNAGWLCAWGDGVAWSDGQSIRTSSGEVLHQMEKGWIEKFCVV